MTPADLRQFIEAVVARVAARLGADGRKGRLVTVFTGASADFSQAVQQVRGLVMDGYHIETVFSEAAEALYGPRLREMLGGLPHIRAVDDARWITAADDAVAVVVPLLSLNTLSRISLLMADNRPTNIILRALFNGRPVVAAQNGVLPHIPHWRAAAGALQPPALKAVVGERLQTFGTYGGRAVDIGELRNAVAALNQPLARPPIAVKTQVSPAPVRRTLRPATAIVTASQVRMAHAAGADLVVSTGVKVTPLARELAQRHGVALRFDPTQNSSEGGLVP
jgi:hypothetical protein